MDTVFSVEEICNLNTKYLVNAVGKSILMKKYVSFSILSVRRHLLCMQPIVHTSMNNIKISSYLIRAPYPMDTFDVFSRSELVFQCFESDKAV